MAAALTVLFVLGPALDPCAGRCDDSAPFAALVDNGATATHADLAPDVVSDEPGIHCMHGHCHQPAVANPAALMDLAATFPVVERPRLLLTAAPPSNPQFDLMRPPRA